MTITTYKEPETNKIHSTLPRIWCVPTATTVIKQRPVMDELGNPVLDETKTPYPLRDEEGKIIRDEDGKPVMDPDRHPPLMEDYEDTVITYDTQMVGLTPSNCESHGWTIVVTELPEPVIVRQLSKIKIRKWLEARGLGEAFKTILASDPDALQDWNDAITLDDNDPKVEAICGMFVSQELLTLEDVATMKEECLSPYQG